MSGLKTLTERKGIDAIESLLLKTECVLTYFQHGDKRVSFDGEIELYPCTSALETKNMLGKIPVQIKSRTVKTRKQIKSSVRIDKLHLINFRNAGGCLFIVVYLFGDSQFEIFYNSLLPSDITSMLKTAKKKDIPVFFKPFPHDSDTIVVLLRSFVDNSKKQTKDDNSMYLYESPNKERLRHIEGFEMTFQGTAKNHFASIFDIPTYIYAKQKGGGIVPFQKAEIDIYSFAPDHLEVQFNGKKYFERVLVTTTKDMETISVGTGFSFYKNGTMKYTPSGNLSQRIQDVEFMLDVCTNPGKEIVIPGVAKYLTNDCVPSNYITESENDLKSYNAIKSALNYYGVNVELECDNLDEQEFHKLRMLASLASGGYTKKPLCSELFFFNYIVSNLNIAVCTIKTDDGFGLVSAFKYDDSDFNIISSNGDKSNASIFIFLKSDNILNMSNIDYPAMEKALLSKPYTVLYASSVNALLLEALIAYDKSNILQILNFSASLAKWLYDNDNNETSTLNYLQTIRRNRDFTQDELNLLLSVKNSAERTESKVGACILIESYLEAKSLWAEMSETERGFITYYPILKLWKEHCPIMEKGEIVP